MAKRFTATEIWNEDWFLEIPTEYKLFWYYMLSNCDHAGLFKVNIISFCNLSNLKVVGSKAIEYFNNGKDRIRVISNSVWFIEDFFVYQYGDILNLNNRVHESISKIYKKHNINYLELRGLKEVKERSFRGQVEVKQGAKDKDIDKDKDKDILNSNIENIGQFWFLKFYHGSYENYKNVFNGQSTTEEYFNEWKSFIDFIYEKKYESIFDAKFVNPQSFEKLVKNENFTKDKWDETIKKILSTGVKPEHDLFFRIPEFMKYVKNQQNGAGNNQGNVKLSPSAGRAIANRDY